MRVYHFMKQEHGLDALTNRRIKVAEISNLNDPFEFLGYKLNDNRWEELVHKIKEKLSKKVGILCFSETYNNPVQWAHYAEQYNGLCLGFDIPESSLHRVKYIQQRPKFPDIRNFTEEVMKSSLLTKFKYWEYEQEWRMYIDIDESKKIDSLYFESFSSLLSLKEVIIGLRSSSTKNTIKEKLSEYYADDIKIYTTRLSKSDFKIIKKRLKY